MKVIVDLDELTGNEYGDTVAQIVRDEIESAVRSEVRRSLKDALAEKKKGLASAAKMWADQMSREMSAKTIDELMAKLRKKDAV
jgi:shikimate kinase